MNAANKPMGFIVTRWIKTSDNGAMGTPAKAYSWRQALAMGRECLKRGIYHSFTIEPVWGPFA